MNSIDYWDWIKQFKPLVNHLDDNAGIDGCLFNPWGKQLEFVQQFKSDFVWSLIVSDMEDDTTIWEIANGTHVVNLQGYLITKEPCCNDDVVIRY